MWDQAIEAHLATARKLYAADKLDQLSAQCGFAIGKTGGNSAKNYADVARYMSAVEAVLGKVAVTSAKMKIMNKARELNLQVPTAA